MCGRRSAGEPAACSGWGAGSRGGTSKTFRQLARIAGAAPSGEGPYVKRVLRHADVAALAERLPSMSQAERARLPGVSASRTPQLPAGAIVADAILDLLDVDQLELCPWALREGVILRRLDMLAQGLDTGQLNPGQTG